MSWRAAPFFVGEKGLSFRDRSHRIFFIVFNNILREFSVPVILTSTSNPGKNWLTDSLRLYRWIRDWSSTDLLGDGFSFRSEFIRTTVLCMVPALIDCMPEHLSVTFSRIYSRKQCAGRNRYSYRSALRCITDIMASCCYLDRFRLILVSVSA